MRHAALAGGKRIRATLTYLAAEALDHPIEDIDQTATAIELIHAYSLVHDDLPAMDDDDLRRGQPTVHVAYDEATAILAGDALQALAFELVANDDCLSFQTRVTILARLASAAGANGMVGGQVLDIAAEQQAVSNEALINIHRHKTGDLIATSVVSGALIAGAPPHVLQDFGDFGYTLGLAFQVRDDILDEIGDPDVMGKPLGSDSELQKSTFVSLHGVEGAQSKLNDLVTIARRKLDFLGNDAGNLLELTDYVAVRMV